MGDYAQRLASGETIKFVVLGDEGTIFTATTRDCGEHLVAVTWPACPTDEAVVYEDVDVVKYLTTNVWIEVP